MSKLVTAGTAGVIFSALMSVVALAGAPLPAETQQVAVKAAASEAKAEVTVNRAAPPREVRVISIYANPQGKLVCAPGPDGCGASR